MTAPSDCDPANAPLVQEARLLVALLRTSRLFLLFAEPGADKSVFLQSSLLPLLQRRVSDQPTAAPQRETGVVVRFPDRRKRGDTTRRKREVVVVFDDWSGAPLAALHTALQLTAAPGDPWVPKSAPPLSEGICALSERFDIQFIVILDRFEEFLRLPAQREGITEFTDALVEALNATQLPASFLLSMSEDARPSLAGLRRRVPGFDDFSLKLPAVVAAVKPTPAQPDAARGHHVSPLATAESTPAAIKPPTRSRAPIKTQDVYALIEDTLIRTASDNDCEPFQGSQPGALVPDRVTPPPAFRLRMPKRVKSSKWPEEFKAEPAAPPPEKPRRRQLPKPTLIGRCKALFSRWRGSRRQTD